MNKKPLVKPVFGIRPAKPVKPIVSPPVPPAPVWTRLELLANCVRFDTEVLVGHLQSNVSSYDASGDCIQSGGGTTNVNIIPPVGNWVEQVQNIGGSYAYTGRAINQIQAGANNTTSVNLTLDGGVGPEKLMRYLKI